jgi:small subunit ribosomal protein S16
VHCDCTLPPTLAGPRLELTHSFLMHNEPLYNTCDQNSLCSCKIDLLFLDWRLAFILCAPFCLSTHSLPLIKHAAPFYRITVADSRRKRDGKYIELVGAYDPLMKHGVKHMRINTERVTYWLSVGAQPSDTVRGRERARERNGLLLKQW